MKIGAITSERIVKIQRTDKRPLSRKISNLFLSEEMLNAGRGRGPGCGRGRGRGRGLLPEEDRAMIEEYR